MLARLIRALGSHPGQRVLCVVAYHVGSTWGILGAELSLVKDRIHIQVYGGPNVDAEVGSVSPTVVLARARQSVQQ